MNINTFTKPTLKDKYEIIGRVLFSSLILFLVGKRYIWCCIYGKKENRLKRRERVCSY